MSALIVDNLCIGIIETHPYALDKVVDGRMSVIIRSNGVEI